MKINQKLSKNISLKVMKDIKEKEKEVEESEWKKQILKSEDSFKSLVEHQRTEAD